MDEFLSENTILLHREYARRERLRFSIIESSEPGLCGKNTRDIYRMRISPDLKRDAIKHSAEAECHELYFSSFANTRYLKSAKVNKQFGSESVFLNDMYRLGTMLKFGFVLVYIRGGVIALKCVEDTRDAFLYGQPILALDVCEHAYFIDYGFDKERYLISALSYLDLTKITEE